MIARNGVSTIIPENGAFVINAGEAHACRPHCDKHSYLTICVDAEALKTMASQVSGKA